MDCTVETGIVLEGSMTVPLALFNSSVPYTSEYPCGVYTRFITKVLRLSRWPLYTIIIATIL